MRKFLMIMSLIASTAVPLTAMAAETCSDFNPEWRACSTDADCVIADNACGTPDGYNKSSLDAVKDHNRCIAPMIDCPSHTPSDTEPSVACKDSVCKLITAPTEKQP